MVHAEMAMRAGARSVGPRRRRARRVVVQPQEARVVRPEARIERARRHAEIARDRLRRSSQRERIAGGVEPRDRGAERRQLARQLRHDRAAVGRAVVVDLLPVARVLRELAVVEAPRVLRRAHDRVLRRERQREERAHLRGAAPPISALVDAVADDLEEAPLAARGVDRACACARVVKSPTSMTGRVSVLIVTLLLRRSCAAAATSAAASTDRARRRRRTRRRASRAARCAAPLRQASNRSVAPPMCVPPMKICGIVFAPVRAASTARILPPRSPAWYATESRSTLRYAMPSRANSLRTDQQNSHHSSANSTTGSSRDDVVDEPLRVGVERDRRRRGRRAAAARRAARRVEAARRRRARQRQLLGRHVLADVLEQRRRQIALAGVGQHADDVRARLRAARDGRAPPRASRRSTCRRRCLRGARARARAAARRRPRRARSRRPARGSRRLRSASR